MAAQGNLCKSSVPSCETGRELKGLNVYKYTYMVYKSVQDFLYHCLFLE